jgi:cysteine desulfurase
MSRTIYLDYAAATPVDSVVLAAMQPYFSQQFYNPSATYLAAKTVHQDIAAARAKIAAILGVRPREIIFTAGASEANNLAIQGVMNHFPSSKVLVSAIEHDSVLKPAQRYAQKGGCELLSVDEKGFIVPSSLKDRIDDKTVLVSAVYANNEIGTIQHLSDMSKVIAAVRADRAKRGVKLPLYLHTDAAQALNYLPVLPHKLGVDLVSLNGGKIYGPKQSGLLFVATGVELDPLILGGGQEWGLRSGTENVPAIIGLAEAITQTVAKREAESRRLQELQQLFMKELAEKVPQAVLTAPTPHKLPNIVHITIPETDNERLMMELDERGIQCALGSACSASNDEPSHVLKALGLTDAEAQTSLRFSMGRSTQKADVVTVVATLATLLAA